MHWKQAISPIPLRLIPPYPSAQLIAVLDIDSEELAAFDDVDQEALEAICARWF